MKDISTQASIEGQKVKISLVASKDELVRRARELRKRPTTAERLLWQRLRARQLGVKFRRQAPIGPYIVDFVCFEKRLVVEIDGGQHNLPDERIRDERRTAWLEALRFRVLRFWNNQVLSDIEGVLTEIVEALNHPPPTPPIKGGGSGK